MVKNNTENDEAQAQAEEQRNRFAQLGATPMSVPDKKSLYKHVARADVAVAEAAQIFGTQRDMLTQRIAEAVEQGDAQTALSLAAQVSELKKGLDYLRIAVAPFEWRPHLPAIRLDDPTEAQQ